MDATIRDWTNLPSEVLSLILSHLFLHDNKRFSYVCKTWQLVPPQRVVPSPIQCPVAQSYWLVFFRGYQKPLNFYHPLFKDTYQMATPVELSDAIIRFSKDGWLLMSRGQYSMFFFNPFTNAKIDLPNLPKNYYFDTISFSSVPTSSDCTVFGILGEFNDTAWFSSISRGEKAWSWHKVESNINFRPSHSNPVFYNEVFYCLGQDCNLGLFNPKEEEKDLSWTVLDDPKKPSGSTVYESYLMECDGKLLSVLVGNKGRGVSVYTLNESRMAWQRVNDLGSKMLFVSHSTSFSATKVVDGMENKIYFPRFCGKDGVFYSLTTNRYESFGSDIRKKDFRATEEQLHCSWIEPKSKTYSEEELNWLVVAG